MEGANQRFAFVRYNETGAAFNQGSYAALVRHDHRSSAGDRFRRGISKIFVLRWQNKNIRIREGRPFAILIDGADKTHGRIQTQPSYLCLQLSPITRIFKRASEYKGGILSAVRFASPTSERVDQQVRTF